MVEIHSAKRAHFERHKRTRFEADFVDAVAFQMKGMHDAEAGDNMLPNIPVGAVSHNYNETVTLDLGDGRWFNDSESASGRPVAIIGKDIADNPFNAESLLDASSR